MASQFEYFWEDSSGDTDMSGSFDSGGNWTKVSRDGGVPPSTGSAPGGSDEAIFAPQGTIQISGSGNVGQLDLDDGTVTFTGTVVAKSVHFDVSSGATFNLQGGSLSASSVTLNDYGDQVVISGGSSLSAGSLELNPNDGASTLSILSGSTASLSVGLGAHSLTVDGSGSQATAAAIGANTIEVADGAAVVAGGLSGYDSHGSDTLNIESGGTVSVTSDYGAAPTTLVTDPGSKLTVAGTLSAGISTATTMTVSAGAAAQAKALDVGENTNSQASVTGPQSLLAVTGATSLGGLYAGVLKVGGGAQFKSGSADLGFRGVATQQGHGTLTIGGAGSTTAIKDGLVVGDIGLGTLKVSNGGALTAKTLSLATDLTGSGKSEVRSHGTATVNNATADITAAVVVGAKGTATLTVSASGHLSAGSLALGTDSAGSGKTIEKSAGTVTVTGAGSEITVEHAATIGEKGSGELDIASKASFTADDLAIAGKGSPTGGNGVDPVTGLHTNIADQVIATGNATIRITDLTVGENGYGALALISSTMRQTGDATLGEAEGAEGQVEMKGGQWSVRHDLTVGGDGKGAIEIGNAGKVAVGGDATFGEAAGSSGQLILAEAALGGPGGTLAVAGKLTLGGGGKASASIAAGGALTARGDAVLGEDAGSSGKLVVGDTTIGGAGGDFSVGGDLTVGGAGSGTLVGQETQAAIAIGGSALTLGEDAGGKGTLTLHGDALSFAGEMVVGGGGKGTVILEQGATIGAGGQEVSMTLAEKVGATGSLTLSGAGTAVVLKDLADGALGKGSVSIKAGATLTAGSADIATAASSNANGVTVDTAGHVAISGDLAVGEKGFGTLTVKGAGGVAVSGEVALGEDAASIGSATVTGATANATTHKTTASALAYGTLAVGAAGSGMLTISKGAAVATAAGGKGIVEIAAERGSIGKLTLTDAHSTLNGKSLAVGGTAEEAGGSATLTIAAAAVATFATATVWKGAKVSVAGGTLHIKGGIEGNGTVTLGEHGSLVLGGHDDKAAISFAAGSDGAVLHLGGAGLLDAPVKGFAQGDSIAIGGLDAHATFAVKASGANTTVTISDGGKAVGHLTLAGHFAKASLHLSAGGVLTTTTAAGAGGHAGAASAAETASADAVGDSFVFDAAPGTGGIGRIVDFTPGDHLALDRDAFHGLGAASILAAAAFSDDGIAHTAHQHILYDPADGFLSYDPDGNGGAAAIHFATLSNHPALTHADFLVI